MQQSENAEDLSLTSQELARAISAIESRREAEAERKFNSVALSEAIRQLGLDITADEVISEVRAQHDAEIAASAAAKRKARRQRCQFWAVFIGTVACFLFLVDYMLSGIIGVDMHGVGLGGIPWTIRSRTPILEMQPNSRAGRSYGPTRSNAVPNRPLPSRSLR
jgi:hypothetical protein